jgi:hypothetical protein
VVLYGDVEYFARLHELFCYYPVVGRWCRITARMIVDENDCRRSFRDRFPEHFSRMHERRVEKSTRYGDVALQSMLGVEHCDVKLFNRQILQTLGEYLVDVARPSNRRALLAFFGGHPPSQLERRVYTNRTSRSHASNAGKRRYRLGGEQSQGPATRRQDLLADAERRPAFGSAT